MPRERTKKANEKPNKKRTKKANKDTNHDFIFSKEMRRAFKSALVFTENPLEVKIRTGVSKSNRNQFLSPANRWMLDKGTSIGEQLLSTTDYGVTNKTASFYDELLSSFDLEVIDRTVSINDKLLSPADYGAIDLLAQAASLTEEDRELLFLRLRRGMSIKQIADLKRIPRSTVAVKMFRLLHRLKTKIDLLRLMNLKTVHSSDF